MRFKETCLKLMSKFSLTSLPALLYNKKCQMAEVRLHDKQRKVYTRSNVSLTVISRRSKDKAKQDAESYFL